MPAIGDTVVGRYELRDTLGLSATRVAYRAFDLEVEVEVALWCLHPELFPTAPSRAYFIAAAKRSQAIRHRHLLKVFEAGSIDAGSGEESSLYMTQQLATSAELEGRLTAGSTNEAPVIVRYAVSLCGALDAIHGEGLHHGWLTPADVVEVAGQVKLCGGGLFASMDAQAALTRFGTDRRYLAPEVLSGRPASAASDWYSLGVLLLELATGTAAESPQSALATLAAGAPQYAEALRAALSTNPAERPVEGSVFLAGVERGWQEQGVSTVEYQPPVNLKAPEDDSNFDETIAMGQNFIDARVAAVIAARSNADGEMMVSEVVVPDVPGGFDEGATRTTTTPAFYEADDTAATTAAPPGAYDVDDTAASVSTPPGGFDEGITSASVSTPPGGFDEGVTSAIVAAPAKASYEENTSARVKARTPGFYEKKTASTLPAITDGFEARESPVAEPSPAGGFDDGVTVHRAAKPPSPFDESATVMTPIPSPTGFDEDRTEDRPPTLAGAFVQSTTQDRPPEAPGGFDTGPTMDKVYTPPPPSDSRRTAREIPGIQVPEDSRETARKIPAIGGGRDGRSTARVVAAVGSASDRRATAREISAPTGGFGDEETSAAAAPAGGFHEDEETMDGSIDGDADLQDPRTIAEDTVPPGGFDEGATVVEGGPGVRLLALSMKPKPDPGVAEPKRKVHAGLVAKPVLRPLSSLIETPEAPQARGILAPPRPVTAPPHSPRRLWVGLSLFLVAGATIVTIALLLTRGPDKAKDALVAEDAGMAEAKAAAPPPARREVLVLGPTCKQGTVHIAESNLCVDAFEAPGVGRQPQSGLSLEDARTACAKRDMRLCTGAEWEMACGGADASTWPYGQRYKPEICNLKGRTIELTGSRAQCRSSFATYDMSGNIAEWVEEGEIRGGSALDRSRGKCSQVRSNRGKQTAFSDVGFRCCADAIASPPPSD